MTIIVRRFDREQLPDMSIDQQKADDEMEVLRIRLARMKELGIC